MITDRPHAKGRSSFEAVQELGDLKDELFQGSMIELFVQAIGMFPTGSIVELNTGEVAVVVEQNRTRRLRPKVVIVLESDKRRSASPTQLDLALCSAGSNEVPNVWITKELEVGSFGITPEEFFLK